MLREVKFDSKNENRLQQALELQKKQQAEQALNLYQLILADYPKHAMVLHLIGITLAQTNQLTKSIEFFQAALLAYPQHPVYMSSLANAYRRQGKTKEAIETFESALSLNPTLISAHHNLALIYFKTQPSKAEHHLKKALDINPDHIDANYNMGLFTLPKNRHKAKEFFQRTTALDPAHTAALFQLAQIHHVEKSYRHALRLYEKVLDAQPNDPECLNKIGLIHLAQDNLNEGIACLSKAVSICPDIEDIHHNLACCYLHKKEYQSALSHWLSHLKINQEPTTYYNIGVTYLYLGRYDDCTDYLFHVIKTDPNHYEALINLGAAFLQKGHVTSACDYYERAQSIQHTPAVAYILNALKNNQDISSAPSDYVTDLFDNYAFHYDNHLLNVLDYQVPKRLQSILPALIHTPPQSLFCLDLGCGTGLAAQALVTMKKTLIGVDLSANMLDIAKKKSIYDRLICQDILTPITEYLQCVDLVLTADTLPYFGDLNPLFSLVKNYIKTDGYWIFTIETTHQSDRLLNQSARFAHHPKTITSLCNQFEFSVFHSENIQLRTQQNQYIEGMIFIVQSA